ncbi:hypothetical protein SSYRP_v1c00570 [Spiroplasma syrphidicola EA-1]|uniref:Lipoprotein n=1 Tax=Spiroplasma syrphidicola EA-1 TaxID=1276229 RepID=R4U536_9MOLU|nr:lipoprotein [Spiroplasma syrphidicola]AGM25653.1 hypothetical protein SSYRP_v1c00570 [Spiroplasma syrphidicola EA-1]
MKKILTILSSFVLVGNSQLTIISCSPNININNDKFKPPTNIVDLKDCKNLFSKDDLTYGYVRSNTNEVSAKIFWILNNSIRNLTLKDYQINYYDIKGQEVNQINTVGTYSIVLKSIENSNYLKGTLELKLDIVDDRIDLGQINYNTGKWFLSSRNTVSDLFKKIEKNIYNAVNDANYKMGQFIDIIITHGDVIYNNENELSQEVLDINNSYIIEIFSQKNNYANIYLTGSIDNIVVNASDERQTVSNLQSDIFMDINLDNLNHVGKDIYFKIRNIINEVFTLTQSQSDFGITIFDEKNNKLNNDQTKLTSLKYQIKIDSTNSLYLKDKNEQLYINIIDKVIHLETLTIEKDKFNFNMTNRCFDITELLFNQINQLTQSTDSSRYLKAKVLQNNNEINSNDYLDNGLLTVVTTPDNSIEKQRFQGILKFSIEIKDNRINLSDNSIQTEFQKYLETIGLTSAIKYSDFNSQLMIFFQKYDKYINNEDIEILSSQYPDDQQLVLGSFNFSVKSKRDSRRLKGLINNVNIGVLEASSGEGIKQVPNSIQFASYDNNDNLHLLTQTNPDEISIYDINLTNPKYTFKINEKIKILDFKTSYDGLNDFWLVCKELKNNQHQISFYKNGNLLNSWIGNSFQTIGTINQYSESAYFRDMPDEKKLNIGSLYVMNENLVEKMDLSIFLDKDFPIKQIQMNSFDIMYIKSDETIYQYRMWQNKITAKINLNNDFLFGIDKYGYHYYQYNNEGLIMDGTDLINTNKLNPLLLPDKTEKYSSQLNIDSKNNFYYLKIDYINHMFYLIKNGVVIFSIKNEQTIMALLHVNLDDSCTLVLGSKIYHI